LGKRVRAALIDVRSLGCVATAALMLAACQPAPPPTAPVPPSPPPAPVVAPTVKSAPPPAAAVALPRMDLPPGPIYRCVVAGASAVLALPENIEGLCRRHPEMGPCQFEREACRQRGGLVLTSLGEEVTPRVEAEYDKRVQRVRFQADGTPKR
jgi:hypothetical protein